MDKAGRHERIWGALGGLLVALAWTAHYLWLTRDRDGYTWMDPYQYALFARSVLAGTRAWNHFEVASIFPYLLMPTLWLGGGSVPAALATQAWITLALLGVFIWLAREFGRPGAWPLLWAFWLGAPLSFGLAHELYCETALTLFVSAGLTATWAAWKRRTWPLAALAGLLWGLSLMLKITSPVFFAGPVLVIGIYGLRAGWRSKEFGAIIKIAACYLAALGLAVVLEMKLFSASWDYWRSLGNTSIPVMGLIGPETFSTEDSLLYYVSVIARYGLTFSLLGLAVFCFKQFFGPREKPLARADAPPLLPHERLWFLAAWVLVPLIVFTIQPVKEPRHILPLLPGLYLLGIILAMERVKGRWLTVFTAMAAAEATLNVLVFLPGGTNRGTGPLPYYTEGANRTHETASAITREFTPRIIGVPEYSDGAVPNADIWVRYNLDIAVQGLTPNEALAMTWALRPAIVYDLDQAARSEKFRSELPLRRYEDLFVYSSFNQYNARCGLPYRYDWLHGQPAAKAIHPQVVIQPANLPPLKFSYLGGEIIPTNGIRLERPGNPRGSLAVNFYDWPASLPNSRQIYARDLLGRKPPLTEEELETVLASLRRGFVLTRDWNGLRAASTTFPQMLSEDLHPSRNLYWYGFYPALEAIERILWESGPFATGPGQAGSAQSGPAPLSVAPPIVSP